MKHLTLWLTLLVALLPAAGRAAGADYGYPISGSYEATILGTPDELKPPLPRRIPLRDLVLKPLPDLKKPRVFFYDKGLYCTLAAQKEKAPLVFLVAGTGAGHRAARMISLTRVLYQAGFHVIALSSPTHPNFIINASASHVPGDLADDAADLYQVMHTAWEAVKDDIEVSDFRLAGYSLGGTQAAFVARLDEERQLFNFSRVLMINPAVSLYDSVGRIEALLDGIPGGPRRIGAFFNRMLDRFVEFYQTGQFIDLDDEFLYAIYRNRLVSQAEAGALIGLTFRINSAGMIFAADVMKGGGYIVPKNRVLATTDSLDDYFQVGVRLSFFQYFDEFFYPAMRARRPGLSREALIDSLSLRAIETYLRNNPKFAALVNDDDFILGPADRDYLRDLFGERTRVYPAALMPPEVPNNENHPAPRRRPAGRPAARRATGRLRRHPAPALARRTAHAHSGRVRRRKNRRCGRPLGALQPAHVHLQLQPGSVPLPARGQYLRVCHAEIRAHRRVQLLQEYR
jgi:hypothetical protein